MANTSEELINSTLVPSSLWNFSVCIKEKVFGTMFCYFIMAFCFLFGTAANSWCLWYLFVDWKNKQTQVFLLNHFIMELILCIVCATEIMNVFIFNNNNNTLFLLIFFLFGLSWTGRPLMQTCICIEQYIAVIHPVTFLRYKGIKYRTAVLATVWLMAFGCGLYYPYVSNYYYISVFVFFMAVTAISFCCVSVLRALKHPGPGDTRKQTGRDVGNQQKKNAFNMILSALLIILLTYLPQVLLFIFTVIKEDQILLECNILPLMVSINVFGVMTTPFMNMYKEGRLKCIKYRKEIKEVS